jgi:hypothetical protein
MLTKMCMLAEFSVIVFDCFNYEILLAKLYLYGICGVSEDWFRLSLIEDRKLK